MTQEPLDRPDIDTRFEQVGRKTVPTRIVTLLIMRRWPRICSAHHPFCGQTVEMVRW